MTRNIFALSVAAAALSIGVAQAQTNTTIVGGGASSDFPSIEQQFNLYTGANPSTLFYYGAAGSGAGQVAFFANDQGPITAGLPASKTYGTVGATTVVDFGVSDAFLTNPGANTYGVATNGSYTYTDANGVTGTSSIDGPAIQIPIVGTAITFAFNPPTYNAGTAAKPSIKQDFTKLTLTDAQICGIFSGQITDWGSVVTLKSTQEPAPIDVVYRNDKNGSGNTFLLTNHFYDAGLGAVCNAGNDGSGSTGFANLTGPTVFFASLFPGGTVPATGFTGGNGAGGVQSAILATTGSIGYVSPDYTAIAPKAPNYNKAVLVAYVVNSANNVAYQPTITNTTLGLTNPGASSTNPKPPVGAANAANPYNWVSNIPTTTKGYPIVGYTTEDLSTCYADKAVTGAAIIAFLTDTFSNASYKAIFTNSGFAPVPSAFVTAIKNDFLTNASKYNLDIDDARVCANYTGR
jgi:ABC-type phosphate transport system substrate-binding protein